MSRFRQITRVVCAGLILWSAAHNRAFADPFQTFETPEGLEATVWAESPKFYNPTNIDVDYRGRVWVSEAVNYRGYNNNDGEHRWHEKGDRIMVVEDTDQDGKADSSHVFVQDEKLVAPMGLSVIDNHVIVSCSPYILKYTDVNRNTKFEPDVDRKEIFLDGFGGLDHDHAVHTVVSGPGGRWHFSTGNAGPHIVTDRSGWTLRAGSFYTGGSPYNTDNQPGLKSDDGRIYVGGIGARIRPDGKDMEIIGHNFRNSYEISVDSFGNYWQSDNDDSIGCRTTWLMEYSNAGYASADGKRRWNLDRRPGQTVQTAHWHQEDPGVNPSGDVYGSGAPTGIERYENGRLGKAYRGMLLVGEAGRNLIWGYHPERKGAGFTLTPSRFTFLEAKSPSEHVPPTRRFRPSDVAVGADGTIYVADWYDPFSGGHLYKEKEAFGAIYRVKPEGENPKTPEIDLQTTGGQLKALKSPVKNVRYAGFVRLREKGDQVVPEVRSLLDHDNRFIAARAIWLMAQLGETGRNRVRQLLDAGKPSIRMTAFRALRRAGNNIIELAQKMVDDPSIAVRREVALALRDVPFQTCRDLLRELFRQYEGEDRWYLEALGAAADRKEDRVYDLLRDTFHRNPVKWTDASADIAWRLHPPQSVQPLKQRAMAGEALSHPQRKRAVDALGFVDTKSAAEAMLHIGKHGPEDTRKLAGWWVRNRRRNLWSEYDVPLPEEFRKEEKFPFHKYRRRLRKAEASREKLAEAAREMAKTPRGGARLIRMASRGEIPDSVTDVVARHIYGNPDPSVRALATSYFPPPGRTRSLPPINKLVARKGDPKKGKQLFFEKGGCSACHRFDGQGELVGPDLTRINRKFGRKGLLEAMINPSSSIARGYRATKVKTGKKTITGILLSEGNPTVVKDVSGRRHTLKPDRIDSMQPAEESLMPSVSLLDLNPQEVVDVATFLASPPDSDSKSE